MANTYQNKVIDLTASFTLADHDILSDAIIILDSDESFVEESQNEICDFGRKSNDSSKSKRLKDVTNNRKCSAKSSTILQNDICRKKENQPTRHLGECPICWDNLSSKQLASTICGHVFCLNCLKHSLKVDKKCPTCRTILKGKSAFHPLYM